MTLDFQMDYDGLTRQLQDWGKRFGDTSEQMVARWAVAAARQAAFETKPPGKSTKVRKQIQQAITNDLVRTCVTVRTKGQWNKLRERARIRLRVNNRWVDFRHDQMVETEDQLWRHVERYRSRRGKVRRIHDHEKVIVWKGLRNKVAASRRRLAGIAKGSWLGAGMDAARYQTGADRVAIGKNYMSWAQKHAHRGGAGRTGGRNPEVRLYSNAFHLKGNRHLWNDATALRAEVKSLEHALKWYQKAVRALDRD